eukprot:scaffold4155_cov70-Phaeocystis_antarctica.AAC.1
MNLALGFSSEWGAETATRTFAGETGSNASRTFGRQQRRNRAERWPRPNAQSCMYVTLRARLLACAVRELAPADRAAAASECRRP